MNSETIVLKPLQTGVTAAVAASSIPALPVKYLGRVFTVPNDQKYLEIVHIPNNPNNVSWGNSEHFRGLMRLILHWPIDDKGVYAPLDLLAQIAGYFNKDRILWNGTNAINITENPISSGSMINDREQLFVSTVEYSLYKP